MRNIVSALILIAFSNGSPFRPVTGITIQQIAYGLPRYAEPCRNLGYAETERVDHVGLQPFAGMHGKAGMKLQAL